MTSITGANFLTQITTPPQLTQSADATTDASDTASATANATTPATGTTTGTTTGTGGVQLSSEVTSLLQGLADNSQTSYSALSTLDSLLGNDNNPTAALLGGLSSQTASNPLAGTPAGAITQEVYASALAAATNSETLASSESNNIGNATVQSALAAYQAAIQAAHPNPTAGTIG